MRVWDVASGREVFSLKGHTSQVYSVAFSRDGRRLASGSQDGTIKLWDAATGQEVLTLKGGPVGSLAFSPDGRRLAAIGNGLVKVWETSPVPAAVVRQREVLVRQREIAGRVDDLFREWGLRAAVVTRLRQDPTLSAPERDFALQLARQREIAGRVHALFEEWGLQAEVVARLRQDPTLSEAERAFALQAAQDHGEWPEQLMRVAGKLNVKAWEVVKTPKGAREAYAQALRQAEEAVRLAPGDGQILNTMGVAQYRMGQYAKAVETLTQSDKLNHSSPADLAFLAMAQQHLGKWDEAQATLGRLREVMKQPAWAKNAESQGFLREAEAVLQGKP
jgi:WD40 repeat protein